MTLEQFKERMFGLSTNRQLDSNTVPLLNHKINVALLKVAKDTFPSNLMVNDTYGVKILKRFDNNILVRYPNEVSDTLDIDICDDLIDAVAYNALTSIEPSRSGIYMKAYYDEIQQYEYNLTKDINSTTDEVLKDYVNDCGGYLMEVD